MKLNFLVAGALFAGALLAAAENELKDAAGATIIKYVIEVPAGGDLRQRATERPREAVIRAPELGAATAVVPQLTAAMQARVVVRLDLVRCDPHDDMQRVVRLEVRPGLMALPGARTPGLSPGPAPLATTPEQLLLPRLPLATTLRLPPRHDSWIVTLAQHVN